MCIVPLHEALVSIRSFPSSVDKTIFDADFSDSEIQMKCDQRRVKMKRPDNERMKSDDAIRQNTPDGVCLSVYLKIV